jgi:hypothetical protein
MDERRGSSSEEPLPYAGARGERRDNVASPGDHREAATSTEAPKRHCGWTDVGLELRGALTRAASPKDERALAPHKRNQRGSQPTGVATGGDPVTIKRSRLRGSTWLDVQVHRQIVAREVDIGPKGRPVLTRRRRTLPFPAGSTFGRPNHRTTPHAPTVRRSLDRAKTARTSSRDRVTHRSSPLTLEWPEDHRWTSWFDLRAATFAQPPKEKRSGSETRLGTRRTDCVPWLASDRSPTDRPRSPSSGPKTTVGRVGSTCELPPSHNPRRRSARAARPGSVRSDAAPRTSSRVESPAERRCPPSDGPKTTVEREASICELPPSNRLLSGAPATDPARSSATRTPRTSSSIQTTH